MWMQAHADREPGSILLASLALFALGLAAWLIGLPLLDPSRLGGLGIIAVLPVAVLLAYGCIIIGFCLALHPRIAPSGLPALFLIALVLILHATPAIGYETLRYSWAWKHIGVVDFIMRTGGLDPDAQFLSAYHNWPAFFLAAAALAEWLQLGPLELAALARFYPTALNLCLLAVLPVLFRNFSSDWRLIWTSVALFLIGNWVGQDYFSPQGTAHLFYLCVLALLTGPLAARPASLLSGNPASLQRPSPPAGYVLLALGLITAVIVIHQITPVFLLSALLLLAATGRLNIGYFLFALVAELLWLFYFAAAFVAPEFADIVASFGRITDESLERIVDLSVVSADQRIVSLGSRALSGIVALGALIGGILRLRAGYRDLAAIALTLAPLPVALATPYGGEIAFRLYLFALPFLAFFFGAAFFPRPTQAHAPFRYGLVGIVLLLMVPGFLLANNGKDGQYRFSAAEVAAADWLYSNSTPGQLLIEGSRNYPSQFRNYENFIYVPLSEELPDIKEQLLGAPDELLSRWLRQSERGGYIIITRSQKAMFDAMGLLPEGALSRIERNLIASSRLKIAFANQDATILTLNQPFLAE